MFIGHTWQSHGILKEQELCIIPIWRFDRVYMGVSVCVCKGALEK